MFDVQFTVVVNFTLCRIWLFDWEFAYLLTQKPKRCIQNDQNFEWFQSKIVLEKAAQLISKASNSWL